MTHRRATWSRPWLAMGILLVAMARADDIGPSWPIAYCASINTSPNNGNYSDFQSEGLCHDFCHKDDYALAIVKANLCWCSNYVPETGEQVDTGKCNAKCPGYPTDVCGADKLYGYISLKAASGTTGGVAQSTDSSTSGIQSVPSTTSESSISPSSATSISSTPTPTPSIQTVTAGGTVKTVTIMPSATGADSASSANISATSGGGLSTGATVGIAVGVVGAVGILVGCLVWMWCRKRRQSADEGVFDSHSQRASSSGMTGTPKTAGAMSENRYMGGSDGQNGAEGWENGKRRSTLMPVDPRLDPYARAMYNGQNKSHESVNSLQDNQDYSRRVHQPSRVLRATNPDPTDD
ncbi:hypothetical protein GQ53DRAFT_379322 [Thozetella sp. PMI_491]|nr:hypothetical protein GQ53DRAFT_379322 [Thozetella sp. PMI_491]